MLQLEVRKFYRKFGLYVSKKASRCEVLFEKILASGVAGGLPKMDVETETKSGTNSE